MSKALIKNISDRLNIGSAILIGPTDVGKTFWVKKYLIEHLRLSDKSVDYFEESDHVTKSKAKVVIIDEVETLFDHKELQGSSPKPYYSKKYLKKIKEWFIKYRQLKQPCLYIITRNNKKEIDHIYKNMHHTDWDGRQIKVYKFLKRKGS